MKYVVLIYGKESDWESVSPERAAEIMGAYEAYTAALQKAGVFVAGEELNVVATAKSVRGIGGTHVVDGPYVDTKESLGGFYLIDCRSDAEALDWAKRAPTMMHNGGVELRPIMVR